MRKRAFSPRAIVPALAILAAVLLAFAHKVYSSYYVTAWYKTSGSSVCNMGQLPAGCTSDPSSGVICTVIEGGVQKTMYGNSSCTFVLYKVQ